ncbi:MAG: flagellar hook-basal body complex protein [Dorea sp.]|nr:flagellar hook-basal body complex protein [Dorea sp.]
MVKSMNAAIAGLKAHQTRLDVIGNNIANVNTWGYKTRTTNFKDSVYTNLINGQSGNAVLGNLGGINVSQLGYGSVVSSVSANFGTSNGQYTGNDLDCMIDGTGFFIVGPYRDAVDNIQEVEGENTEGQFNIANSGMLLSRVGIFTPDANGYLVDDSGNYVFGYIPDNQTPNENNVVPMNYDNLVPIRIPVNEETGEMYSISSWRIGQSGTIIGTATNGDIVTIGQIAVASVENPNGLNQKTGYYYEVGNNAGRCIAMQTTAATGNINSGFLEMSNTDIASDFAAMITTQRGYQANTKIITVTDEILEQLVNMKR